MATLLEIVQWRLQSTKKIVKLGWKRKIVGNLQDITLGWGRKSQFRVQSNDKAWLGNCRRCYLRVTLANEGLSCNLKQVSRTTWIKYIWQTILAFPSLDSLILKLVVEEPQKDWSFGSENLIFVVHTNDVYCKLVEAEVWLANKVSIHGTILNL